MSNLNDLLVKMIKAIQLFGDISDDEALELSKEFVLKFFQVGDIIIREGEALDKIYLLKNGDLVAKKSNGLQSITLGRIQSGEVFGEMSCLKDTIPMATVEATQDSDVWEISKEQFVKFLKKYPHIMNTVYNTMQKREQINSEKLSG